MVIYRHSSQLPAQTRGAVVAIGNFDGLHRGHRALLEKARTIAREASACFAVLTFEPHPLSVFRPELPPFRLTPLRAKAHWLECFGADALIVQHFDRSFAAKDPESFIDEMLLDHLALRHLVVGWDFRFGFERRGDVQLLRRRAVERGFGITVMEPVMAEGQVFSSTRIRELLRQGRPEEAAALLGRPFEIEGRVEQGDRRGRLLGFPTANLALGDYLQPALGVYAVEASLGEPAPGRPAAGAPTAAAACRWHPGVANLGRRPTVKGQRVQLEVHLFDFSGDLYGKHLRVRLLSFLREEKRFDGLDSLQAQIARDSGEARRILAERRKGPVERPEEGGAGC